MMMPFLIFRTCKPQKLLRAPMIRPLPSSASPLYYPLTKVMHVYNNNDKHYDYLSKLANMSVFRWSMSIESATEFMMACASQAHHTQLDNRLLVFLWNGLVSSAIRTLLASLIYRLKCRNDSLGLQTFWAVENHREMPKDYSSYPPTGLSQLLSAYSISSTE